LEKKKNYESEQMVDITSFHNASSKAVMDSTQKIHFNKRRTDQSSCVLLGS